MPSNILAADSLKLLCLLSLFIGSIVHLSKRLRTRRDATRSTKRCEQHNILIEKPQLLKCSVSHRRLYPRRHGFIYSYLAVGIPVRAPRSNWLLSVNNSKWWTRGIFHVTAKDHLYRGRGGETLSENLDDYLRGEGLEPKIFSHVYLLTSPRFFNYKFSPASFWYLYTANQQLRYVIAEVNNTFDERRMYLFPFEGSTALGKCRQTCKKDFHVSPFSSRKGSYRLSTANPAHENQISITVTLRSSNDHGKLVACWRSIGPALDPSTTSVAYGLWFVICWGWTALLTFPRIVYQAVLLAHIRKLSIWYRPEPRASTVPRRAIAMEIFLASVFLDYLQHLLDLSLEPVCISISPGIVQRDAPWDVRLLRSRHSLNPNIQLNIYTPQFYRKMITYPTLTDFLADALLHPHEENRTAGSTEPEHLVEICKHLEQVDNTDVRRTLLVNIFWRLIQAGFILLHATEPQTGVYPNPGNPHTRGPDANKHDFFKHNRVARPCFLTEYVFKNNSKRLQARYMVATLTLQWRSRIAQAFGGE